MSSIPRLHVEGTLAEGAAAPLSPEQAHYLRNVMRREVGEPVHVFNARDGEFEATIAALSRKGAVVEVDARRRTPEAEPDLWLLIAPVKRGPLETIVQKATELGVSRLLPVITARTNAQRLKDERLAAIAVEAAEQCGRLSVPEIAPAQSLFDLLKAWPAPRRLMFCDEAGDDPGAEWGGKDGRAAPALEALSGESAGPWAILIGPEGGFSPEERAELRRREFVRPVTLGPRILRADTAAIAALALWQASLGDFKRS